MIQRLYTAEKMEEKYKVLQEIDEFDVCDDERHVADVGSVFGTIDGRRERDWWTEVDAEQWWEHKPRKSESYL